MSRFYSIHPKTVEEMDVEMFHKSYEAMNIIKAREKLSDLSVVSYPHAKENDRSKAMRDLDQIAFPLKWAKTLTSEEAVKLLQAKGFGGRSNKNPASNRQGSTTKRR